MLGSYSEHLRHFFLVEQFRSGEHPLFGDFGRDTPDVLDVDIAAPAIRTRLDHLLSVVHQGHGIPIITTPALGLVPCHFLVCRGQILRVDQQGSLPRKWRELFEPLAKFDLKKRLSPKSSLEPLARELFTLLSILSSR